MRRRTVLGLAALGAAGAALAACGDEEQERVVSPAKDAVRHDYGPGPSQYGELAPPRRDAARCRGGRPRRLLALGVRRRLARHPLARDLARRGWAAWNLEYRRVGPGMGGEGGAPATFDDVATGIDLLATLDVDTSTVVTLGHSAGGHLATWAAGRAAHGWPAEVPVTHVISQAGVLDLRSAAREQAGRRSGRGLPGARADHRGRAVRPRAASSRSAYPCGACTAPTTTPFRCSSRSTTSPGRRPRAAPPSLVEVAGDHFVVIDPTSKAWARQVEILDGISGGAPG
ncbi:hypothetical protein [Nocardioides convexus]|uniref:alpha/beta hydrolase n=1 Tax=Nocardioides convexus TaxID=2712224 RepID=UPI0024189040|nr:hypothetical protein [Nocardioides convexus]